jgi:hypothetical protein
MRPTHVPPHDLGDDPRVAFANAYLPLPGAVAGLAHDLTDRAIDHLIRDALPGVRSTLAWSIVVGSVIVGVLVGLAVFAGMGMVA